MSHLTFHSSNVLGPSMKIKYKIVCIESWGNKILLGCNDCCLRVFQGDEAYLSFKQIASQKDFAKKNIEQLCVVKHRGQFLLLAIVDSYVRVYEMPSFKLRHQVDRSRGCYLFAINKGEIPAGKSSPNPTNNTANVDLVICIALKKRNLLVFKWDNKNSFVHLSDLVVPDTVRSMEFAGASICVAFKKEYSLFKLMTGEMSEIFPVGRKPAIALLPEQEILLVKDTDGICVGYDGKPTRKHGIKWSECPSAICYSHPNVIAVMADSIEIRNMFSRTLTQTVSFKNGKLLTRKAPCMFIASQNNMLCIWPVPLNQQISNLIRKAEFKEAICLVENSVSSEWSDEKSRQQKLNELRIKYAYHLFNTGDYDRAMRYFRQTDIDPRQVLALFPDVLPRGQITNVKHPVMPKPIKGEDNFLRALTALVPFLNHLRNRCTAESHPPERELRSRRGQGLKDFRKEDQMTLPVLVDTVMLKSYLSQKFDPLLVMHFLQGGTFVDIEEGQSILRAYGKEAELVCLYRTRNYHRKALTLLSKVGQNDSSSPLHGTLETVKYLQQLAQNAHDSPEAVQLVLEFSSWVLKKNRAEGLRIFTHAHTTREMQDGMPAPFVLEHLKSVTDNFCCIEYLESLIGVGETNAMFHNELTYLYLDGVLKEMTANTNKKKHLKSSVDPDRPPGIQRDRVGIPSNFAGLRRKLLKFLKNSTYYNPEKMLSKFPQDSLLEERAILLSRINHHTQALTIYAHQLKDHAMAERYCEEYYNEHSEEEKDMYLHLLTVYLSPPDNLQPRVQPDIDASVRLLAKYCDRIDTPKALEKLPDGTPIYKLMPFFQRDLSRKMNLRRNSQVVKHLLRAEHLRVRMGCLSSQRHRVYITKETLCPKCNKKIGNSAFVRYSTGQVMHYICSIAGDGP